MGGCSWWPMWLLWQPQSKILDWDFKLLFLLLESDFGLRTSGFGRQALDSGLSMGMYFLIYSCYDFAKKTDILVFIYVRFQVSRRYIMYIYDWYRFKKLKAIKGIMGKIMRNIFLWFCKSTDILIFVYVSFQVRRRQIF